MSDIKRTWFDVEVIEWMWNMSFCNTSVAYCCLDRVYYEKIDDTKGVGEAVNQRSDNTRTKTKENKHKRTNSDLQNTTRKTTNIRGYLCQ